MEDSLHRRGRVWLRKKEVGLFRTFDGQLKNKNENIFMLGFVQTNPSPVREFENKLLADSQEICSST